MMPDFATTDLIDEFEDILMSCSVQFRNFGARRRFCGPIRTLRCRNDNALLKELFGQPGEGAVMVFDGGGLLECALMGDLIAGMGMDNGWAGIVINGAVRDVGALAEMDFGIKALGSNPAKSTKTANGKVDIPLAFGSCIFQPGHWLYSDEDGIVIAPRALL